MEGAVPALVPHPQEAQLAGLWVLDENTGLPGQIVRVWLDPQNPDNAHMRYRTPITGTELHRTYTAEDRWELYDPAFETYDMVEVVAGGLVARGRGPDRKVRRFALPAGATCPPGATALTTVKMAQGEWLAAFW